MKKKVQLVLGSGGARGIAHIGVIEMLLQDGYEIVEVIGCSMGAVIGGMYCAGYLPAYKEWLLKQSKTDVYRMFDFAFSLGGLVKGERIFTVLHQLTGDLRIEELHTPFMAVSTNILTRKEVHFRSGDLYKALRASTGIPGVFTPVADGNKLYVDGGVLNPLPVDLVKRRKDAIVVAVNLNGMYETDILPKAEEKMQEVKEEIRKDEIKKEEAKADMQDGPTEDDIITRLRKYFNVHAKPEKAEPVIEVPSFSMFELFSTSIDTSIDRITEMTLKAHPVDIVVEIPRNVCSVFEFYRAEHIIQAGHKGYEKAFKSISVQ